jgi:hypothetical protein
LPLYVTTRGTGCACHKHLLPSEMVSGLPESSQRVCVKCSGEKQFASSYWSYREIPTGRRLIE